MDREQTQALLDEYYQAFNSMDKAAVLSVFTEDADFIDFTMGRNMKGRTQLAAFIDETWERSPYFRLEPEIVVIDDGQAAVQLYMSGAAKLESPGQPKPSNLWRIPSTSFFRFQGSRISWKADCWNALAVPRQIGWLRTLPALVSVNRKNES